MPGCCHAEAARLSWHFLCFRIMAKQKYGPRLDDHRQQHRAAIACPSSSLLSILATIAASSHTVDGSPLPQPTPPPSFLCPSIEHHNIQIRDPTPTTSYTTITASSSATTTTTTTKSTPQVADKYVQGSDGRWRKAQAWTLYGSTCCSSSPDLTVDDSQSTQSSIPAVSTQIDSVLPAGWTTSSSSNRTDSIIILSLAIVLAVSICFFIIGCIVWRKRRKKRSNREKKKNDLELKARDKANLEDPSEDGEREIEARGKNRLWARASARWKANIRQSARRRRNRRHGFSSGRLSRSQSPTLLDPHEASPRPSSIVLSRRHSIAPVSEDNDFHVVAVENSPTPTRPPSTSPDPSCSHTVSSPPAYIFPALHMPPEIEEASHITSGDTTPRRRPLLFPPVPEDDEIPYHPSYAGHVAIDDKAHLARMAELASAPPPVIEDNIRGSVSPICESAPEWHDDFEDPPSQPDTFAPSEISPFDVGNSGFPIPPSKSILSPGYFDGHSYLDDITTLDPISLPSMPPYEAGPNTIPFVETLRASAPPISEDDQAFDHWEGSAPEESDIYGDERDTHISLSPPLPSSSALSSRDSAPLEQVVSMDGVLPIYQP